MSKRGTLFISCCELGWDYLRWSGYCRRVASQNDDRGPFFVCTHEGREILYKDFCEGSINHDFWFILKRDAGIEYGNPHGYGLTNFSDNDFDELGRWASRVVYQKYGVSCDIVRHPIGIKRKYEYEEQQMATIKPSADAMGVWASFSSRHLDGRDFIVAVFPRKKGDIRDWGEDNYVALMHLLSTSGYGVVIGGDPSMSFCTSICTKHSNGIVNLTRLPQSLLLDAVLAALRDCKLAVGSQSVLPIIAMGQGVTTYMWGCEPVRHSKYYNWSGMDCYFTETQDYSLSYQDVFDTIERIVPHAENKWPHVASKRWAILKKGEKLPDEKNKKIAKAYSEKL